MYRRDLNVNNQHSSEPSYFFMRPLHLAAFLGRSEMLKMFLERSDIDANLYVTN